ncbi:SDR family NAD(P)-dependent oxidoreductase [Streptomyces tubercidicus]
MNPSTPESAAMDELPCHAHAHGLPDAGPLRGRTVVLIGGGSGIGLRVAHQAVAAGARVVLGGRTPARLVAAAAELGGRACWRAVDTTDRSSLASFFAELDRVDHLFTSAGTRPQDGPSSPPGRRLTAGR